MSTSVDPQNAHARLDLLKLRFAETVLREFNILRVRQKSLANLVRWKKQGTWCSAYDEWTDLMTSGSDADVINAMTSPDENANRLRQSPPFVGLLDQATVDGLPKKLNL